MADFAVDTAVQRIEAGRHRAELSPAWEVWGPVGGYVAAIALRVSMSQGGAPILSASGWFVGEGMAGLEHEYLECPAVPSPDALKSYAELADNYADWYPFWRAADGRPLRWEEPHPPQWQTWNATLFCRSNPMAKAAATAST